MNTSWVACASPQALRHSMSNSTITARLIVKAPFEHTEDNIVVTDNESFNFRLLWIIKSCEVSFPFTAYATRQRGKNSVNACI